MSEQQRSEQQSYSFKVDLKGIIRLLSDNLYSSSDVFLRELLQNAVDAITARKNGDKDYKAGSILIEYQVPETGKAVLCFKDNGIGLTKDEIHTFLSVIGQSSKRGELKRNNYIGQFGIGLLSCFLAADEIVVYSRSARETQGYRWTGSSDGTYQVSEAREELEVGTQVQLILSGDMFSRYSEERIIGLLQQYSFMIPTPVNYAGIIYAGQLNDAFVPWRQSFCTAENILQFGELLFHESFTDAVPLIGDGLKGYAFISKRVMSAAAANQHKIYLKNMLITEEGRDVIPKWAFFVRCILNVEDLTPTASREHFVLDHKLVKVRNQIEKCIFDYFTALSEYNADRLKHITMTHNVAIKSLAVDNERVFKLIFPFLTFSTNRGPMTGLQIIEKSKQVSVYYCVELDDYKRVTSLVSPGKSILINAGYIYDSRLIRLASSYYNEVKLQEFDDSLYETLFNEPPAELQKEMALLLRTANRVLSSCGCKAALKQLESRDIQAMYVANNYSMFENTIGDQSYSDLFDDFLMDEQDESFAMLYLNTRNPLIRKLGQISNLEMLAAIVQILYVQALLAGHYPLGEKERGLMDNSLGKLVEIGAGGIS